MDKNTLSKICLVCVLSMAAGSAAYATTISGTTVMGTSGTFATSSNVTVDVKSASAQYAAGSQHLNGDRFYFTNSINPLFYYGSKSKGTTATVVGNATDTASTSWNSL